MPDHLLSLDQKKELSRRWAAYDLTLEAGLELRRQARTDLYFLANGLLGHTLAECHKEVCEFFIHKDPDAKTFYEFASNYDYNYVDCWGRPCIGSHSGLLWLMRSGLKSSIDVCDNVQWIITFPNIRIRILTDRLELSQQFVKATQDHFTLEPDGSPRIMPDGNPSLFQVLFPEFCDTSKAQFASNDASPKWTCPARSDFTVKGPTIIAGSMEGGKTGSHCDVLKFDDAQTPENIGTGKGTAMNLKNTNTRIAQTMNLLDYPGFVEYLGTPQHALDYGSQKVTAEQSLKAKGLPPVTRLLIRPAYVPLPGFEGKPPDQLEKHQVIEWWPERMPFEKVLEKWHEPEGRDVVATQQLLDVSLKTATKFKRMQLEAATLPWNRVPSDGTVIMTGDLAYSTKDRADYTVLGTATLSERRLYVTQVKRERIQPRLMGAWIAGEIFVRRPQRVIIEDSPGAQWLHNDIEAELRRLSGGQVAVQIEWEPPGKGIWKRIEIEADWTARVLDVGRLIFATSIEKLEDVFEELEVFPHPKHHDDIVSMLNRMCKHFLNESDVLLGGEQSPMERARESLWTQQQMGYPGVGGNSSGLNDLFSMELPE